ncbi:hypothetical protein BRARA_I02771 [Brassica rapa]|uniref:DUF1985 domain-containing protein n=1 Tax=Brassica campestris TaxID=3711 RepID=A0A397Y342_BRACM|nr:hypothetical protein BRARA_I02771 [Brassica rapa]
MYGEVLYHLWLDHSFSADWRGTKLLTKIKKERNKIDGRRYMKELVRWCRLLTVGPRHQRVTVLLTCGCDNKDDTAKRVFDDDALMTYPWGQTAYEFLVDSIKLLHPQGGSYTLSGFKYVLLVWAYESVTVFGEFYGRKVNPAEILLLRWGGSRTRASLATTIAKEMNDHGTVRVRKMVMKEGIEELFPQWKDKADDPQLDNLIKDIHADRFVRDFYVQSNEKNKKTKAGISSEAEPPSKKQKKEDNQQPESNSGQPDGQNMMVSEDNRQPDSNSGQPASKIPIDKQFEDSQPQKTPDKGQSEKNLADDIAKADAKGMGAKLNSKVVRDKAAGVKKNLDSAFGNADATNADLVSDSPGKEPPFGRGCRGLGKRNNLAADLERNEAELKKKQKQEEAELKRKKKQEEAEFKKKQKKEEAELKKKKKQEEAYLKKKKKQEEADSKKDIPASKRTRSGTIRIPIPTKQIKNTKYSDELWPESDVEEDERKRCGRINEYRLKAVQLSPDGSQMSAEFGPSVAFPHIGDNVTTCMRKTFEPSPAIYDPLGPADPVKRDNLLQHLKPHE